MAKFIDKLNADVILLKDLLSQCSTDTITGVVKSRLFAAANGGEKESGADSLLSPVKQMLFLLSLMLATPEPANGKEFGDEEWNQAKKLLGKIFGAYQELFWPSKDELNNLSKEWWKIRETAMLSFLHYFNTALLASVEQISERIEKYCFPFDNEVKHEIGISAKETLEIVKFIHIHLQSHVTSLSDLALQEKVKRLRILDEAEAEIKSYHEFDKIVQQKIKSSSYSETLFPLIEAINNIGKVAFSLIKEKFPTTAQAYWNNFTIKRGDGPALHYPTEKYVYESKPLILEDLYVANCPYPNKLFEAVLITCEEVLEKGKWKKAFLNKRDKVLEDEAEFLFKKILGQDSQIFKSAFETPDAHLEHDLIIVSGNKLLIVEAKAKPPVEPFRDPEKAFVRISRAFKSESGIQGAFEQGIRILRKLDYGEIVSLYDRKGNLLTKLNPQVLTKRFCACVTRDDYGYLATNLSLLLEKNPSDSFPWVVNILDLGFVRDAWEYFNWNNDKFFDYLSQRLNCHGKVIGGDELEFLGAFIHHGSLKKILISDYDVFTLDPSYAKFFDDLYYHLHHGRPAPKIKIVKPIMTDLRNSLESDKPEFISNINEVQNSKKKKLGRNDSCFCGSGKKYKKCHG